MISLKPIDDIDKIEKILSHSDMNCNFNGELLHENISYLGAYIDDELVGIYRLKDNAMIDCEIHFAMLKKAIEYQRQFCLKCIKHVFDLGYARITVSATDYARKMVNLVLKLGFILEGKKREACFYNGVFYDEYILGMLKRDWELI